MIAIESNHYLFAADFEHALGCDDAGEALAELLGITDYAARVARLAESNVVQHGGELPYLVAHDPAFRKLRREQLIAAGRRVRLKRALPQLVRLLEGGISGLDMRVFVVSAAPTDLVAAALEGVVPRERIVGTSIDFDPVTGAVAHVHGAAAGFGRVAIIDDLCARHGVRLDRVIYVGHGAADVHAMLHVNNHYGFTVAVTENRLLAQVAQSTVISDHACSILMPVLEQVFRWRRPAIRAELEKSGLRVDAWQKTRTDTVRIAEVEAAPEGYGELAFAM
jgi:phosphoserine phosphatase